MMSKIRVIKNCCKNSYKERKYEVFLGLKNFYPHPFVHHSRITVISAIVLVYSTS